MANFRGRGVIRRSRSSNKTWAGLSSGDTWTPVAAGGSLIVGSFIVGLDSTLVRVRGMLGILSDSEVEEEVHGAIGIARVTEDAFSSGIAAVPVPIADIDSDSWVLWQPFIHARAVGTASGQSPAQSNFVLDSKAMRKFTATDRLVIVLENDSSVFGLRFMAIVRALVVVKGTGG